MANLDGVDRSHYERFKIQPIEFVRANNLPWDQGEIIKYVCRHPYKNGLEDLLKARSILEKMIEDEIIKKGKPPIGTNRVSAAVILDPMANQAKQNVETKWGPWG